jgi:hypothetical protein
VLAPEATVHTLASFEIVDRVPGVRPA